MTRLYTFEERDEPYWAVETNGPGLGLFNILTESDKYDLPNPFMMQKFDVAKQSISTRKGWWTDTSSRRQLITGVREWLKAREGWCDSRCARELTTFVYRNGKGQAKEGSYDDEVMCLGIALIVDTLVPEDSWEEYPELAREESLIVSGAATDKDNWREVERARYEELCYATIENQRAAIEELAAQFIEVSSAQIDLMLSQFGG